MRRSGTGSGGGHGSKNVRKTGVHTGSKRKAATPGGVAQVGYSIGEHVTERKGSSGYRGEPLFKGPAYQSELGNECALESAGNKAGPGSDRTVMKTGSQGTHGPVNKGQSPERRDTISEFGPDYQRKGRFG